MKSNIQSVGYFLLLCLMINACNIQVGDSPVDAPPKPDNVPASTLWSGGPDGGVFLTISKNQDDAPDIYRGQIFNDQTGELEYSGKFKINENSKFWDLKDPATYAGWDGSRLHMADGRYLTALEISDQQ